MKKHDNATLARAEAFSAAGLLLDAADRGVRYRAAPPPIAGSPRTPPPWPRWPASTSALPDRGRDPRDVLDQIDRLGSPATVTMSGGRYFGFVNGSSLPVTVASNWLATAWDQNCALHVMSPAAATIEAAALRWTLDALRLPADSAGAFVVGATMANFTALAAARHAVLARAGWNVDDDGLHGAPPVTVVVGAEVHSTVRRVLGLLGFGRSRAVVLPVDGQGRIAARDLPRLSGPAIVCLQAGNVNTGALDPAAPLCAWAHEHDAWVHVDGAFGLWARACPDPRQPGRRLRAGRLVGHRRAQVAQRALRLRHRDGPRRGGAARRHGDDRRLPAALRASAIRCTTRPTARAAPAPSTSGRRWPSSAATASPISSTAAAGHAARMARGLAAAGHEVLNDVTLNQVLVAFGDDRRTARGHRGGAGRRRVLVRRHALAGARGDADQRVVLRDDRCRHRGVAGVDPRLRAGGFGRTDHDHRRPWPRRP